MWNAKKKWRFDLEIPEVLCGCVNGSDTNLCSLLVFSYLPFMHSFSRAFLWFPLSALPVQSRVVQSVMQFIHSFSYFTSFLCKPVRWLLLSLSLFYHCTANYKVQISLWRRQEESESCKKSAGESGIVVCKELAECTDKQRSMKAEQIHNN